MRLSLALMAVGVGLIILGSAMGHTHWTTVTMVGGMLYGAAFTVGVIRSRTRGPL